MCTANSSVPRLWTHFYNFVGLVAVEFRVAVSYAPGLSFIFTFNSLRDLLRSRSLSLLLSMMITTFLVADTQFYERLCPSIGLSVNLT